MRRNIHQANRQGDLLQRGLCKAGLFETQATIDPSTMCRLRADIPDPAHG